ncbi:MAG: hydrogenase iron-sulfur subunit [Anaerolineae bacterium]
MADNSSIDWERRQGTAVKKGLNVLERISLVLETPVARLAGDARFNPLYHTGTISVFLLVIVLVTGIYLTMFYQFGFEASYEAVSRIEANFVGRLMRALHRYASIAVVFTALLHGWRMLFQDRFRGPRWLAWLSGVVMAGFVWAAGVTGYWLISDQRTELLNQLLIDAIAGTPWGFRFVLNRMVLSEGSAFMLIMISLHLGLSAVIGGLLWLHLKRLSRAKVFPPQYWMAVIGGLLLIVALLVPVGMLPRQAGLSGGTIRLDVFYLFFLPAPGPILIGLLVVLGLSAVIPWILIRPRLDPVEVHAADCTGCTLCAADCPYNAITMHARDDDTQYHYIAVIDPTMCVSCGVCVGSCAPKAISMGDQPNEPLWQQATTGVAEQTVVFACERHTSHGARNFSAEGVTIVPVTCVGMVQPDLTAAAWHAGAAEVRVIGCPPEDCTNREGNLWLEERLNRERKPQPRRRHADLPPVKTTWLPPNDFRRALTAHAGATPQATGYKLPIPAVKWGQFIPAIVMMLVVLGISVALSNWPYESARAPVVQIALDHRTGNAIDGLEGGLPPDPQATGPTRLVIAIDDEVVFDETYTGEVVQTMQRLPVTEGTHRVRVTLYDRPGQQVGQVLLDQVLFTPPGAVVEFTFRDEEGPGDPAMGRRLYEDRVAGVNAGCRVCHSTQAGVTLVGPSFYGIADRAGERVPGLSAEAYLYQSIVDPDAYVVEGVPSGTMLPNLDEILTEQQIEDLVAYLMSLEASE